MALNRFVSKLADKCRPFFQLLKKWKGFRWMEECNKAFQDLKHYLASLPILSNPEPREDLYMYLVGSNHAIGTVLIRVQEGTQKLVYYVSKTLGTQYLPLEKMPLALVHVTRKLPHYFQAHTIYVLTKNPLQALLRRSDFTRRIVKQGTRLGSFDVWYRQRNAIKGWILENFVAEFAQTIDGVQGVSNFLGAGIGIVLVSPKGIKLEHLLRLGFPTSNNEVEYEALMAGLRATQKLGVEDVEVYSDSSLVVSQLEGSFEAKDPQMTEYLNLVKLLQTSFGRVKIAQISRGHNSHADSLAILASSIKDY